MERTTEQVFNSFLTTSLEATRERLEGIRQVAWTDEQRSRHLCEEFRDEILKQSEANELSASGLLDLASALNNSDLQSDDHWKALQEVRKLDLAQYRVDYEDMRKQNALTSIIAIWSSEIVDHYQWRNAGRDTLDRLRACAIAMPDFRTDFAPHANVTMVRRHEESISSGTGRSTSMICGMRRSSLLPRWSPLTPDDIKSLANEIKPTQSVTHAGSTKSLPNPITSEDQLKLDNWCSDDTRFPVHGTALNEHRPQHAPNFLLATDRHGLLVLKALMDGDEDERLRFNLKAFGTEAPRNRSSKRRKTDRHVGADHDDGQAASSARVAKAGATKKKSGTMSQGVATKKVGASMQKGAANQRGPARRSGLAAAKKSKKSFLSSARVDSGNESSENESASSELPAETTEDRIASEKSSPDLIRESPLSSHTLTHNIHPANTPSVSAYGKHGETISDQSKAQHPRPAKRSSSLDRHLSAGSTTIARQAQPYIGSSLRRRYGHLVNEFSDRLAEDAARDSSLQLRAAWLRRDTKWAKVFSASDSPLGFGEAAREEDADIVYCTSTELRQRSLAQKPLDKPFLIRQDFEDSGSYTLCEFAKLLRASYAATETQVRKLNELKTIAKPVSDLVECLEKDSSPSQAKRNYGLNALDFCNITQADEPSFTRLYRYRLLEFLSNSQQGDGPGKKTILPPSERYTPIDVSSCMAFNILGFTGAFSGAHLDALTGTFVRNLCGVKFWMIVPPHLMTDNDWAEFRKMGVEWNPNGKERLVVLEQDDVLVMPPGIPIIHAVHTPQSSLMQGGMFWDNLNIIKTLESLYDIGRYQITTNEAIAHQLRGIIDQLHHRVQTTPEQFVRSPSEVNNFLQEFEIALLKLRSLGCECRASCGESCPCLLESRRCTAFCKGHPRCKTRPRLKGMMVACEKEARS